MPHDDPLCWTVQETAEQMRLSIRKVWYLIASGDLDTVHIDRSRRVLVESVRRLLDRNRVAA